MHSVSCSNGFTRSLASGAGKHELIENLQTRLEISIMCFQLAGHPANAIDKCLNSVSLADIDVIQVGERQAFDRCAVGCY